MGRVFEVGITASTDRQGWRADALSRQAQAAEALGFHSFWLPENHFGDQRSLPSPLMVLAAVAATTSRIKLATTSYLLPIRHPLLAAEEVAVLDQLCRGRLILGLGRGIQDSVFRAFDLPPGKKRELFQANLEVMRSAWAGEPLVEDATGAAVQLAPLPLQRPHPPLWVAAFGPLALKQAGGLGLPYIASPVESLDVLEQNYRRHQAAVAEAGHQPVSTIPVMRTVFITPKPGLAGQLRDRLQTSVPPSMRDKASAVEDWAIVGDRSYARDKLAEYVERLGVTHLVARGGLSRVPAEDQAASQVCLLDIAQELG